MSQQENNTKQPPATAAANKSTHARADGGKPSTKRRRTHAGLEAPQFRLSTFMLLITGFCMVLAASLWLPPLMTFALILLALAILAHVAGNFYGTKLRDGANDLVRHRGGLASSFDAEATKQSLANARAARSNLTEKAPVGLALAVFIIAGAVAFIVGGCYWLGTATQEPLSWPDYVMSSIAFGALGGIFGFMLGGFVCISWRAMRQAVKESDR